MPPSPPRASAGWTFIELGQCLDAVAVTFMAVLTTSAMASSSFLRF
jgi:hypothetical protein